MPQASDKDLTAPTVQRLSQYLLLLEHLVFKGKDVISSRELAQAYGNTPSQVRQDFFQLSLQSRPGLGYNVSELIEGIRSGLGIEEMKRLCIIGVGNLGGTLASHIPFEKYGMEISALFDKSPSTIGTSINGIEVQPRSSIQDIVTEKQITLAAICVPDNAAQSICDLLVESGIKGILNFSRVRLHAPANIKIHYQQMVCSFMQLSYAVSHPQI